MTKGWLWGCLVCCAACPAPPPLMQPDGWDDGVRLAAVEDLDPSDDVVRVALEARITSLEVLPGTRSNVWSYNGHLPGPLLRARAGQTLVVQFTNALPAPTTVHWHGLRVPNPMDGSEASQPAIPPGGTFEYRFELRDAGTFWFHSHVDSSAQVGHGLYGLLVVDPPPPDAVPGDVLGLVFSDMSLAADGTILPGDSDGALGSYFGREGNVLLLNGKVRPALKARAGVPQRWHLVNAARSRYFQTFIPGARVFRLGGDGGRLERPEAVTTVNLTPGERVELWVVFDAPTSTRLTVNAEDANRFHLPAPQPAEPLLTVDVEPALEGQRPAVLPDTLRHIERVDPTGALPREVTLGEAADAGAPVLTINGLPVWDAPPLHAALGTTEAWTVVNETEYDHPVHLHGFFFQVLDVAGKPWPRLEWKDTVNVPQKARLRFLVQFDERPGRWMFHCHILDHAELGMMALLNVE